MKVFVVIYVCACSYYNIFAKHCEKYSGSLETQSALSSQYSYFEIPAAESHDPNITANHLSSC